jgi:hypothetical protein
LVNSGVCSSTYYVSKCKRGKAIGGVKTVKGLDKVQKANIFIFFVYVKSEIFTFIRFRKTPPFHPQYSQAAIKHAIGVLPAILVVLYYRNNYF